MNKKKIINHFKKLIFEIENIQEKLSQLAHTLAITYSYGLIGPVMKRRRFFMRLLLILVRYQF